MLLRRDTLASLTGLDPRDVGKIGDLKDKSAIQ